MGAMPKSLRWAESESGDGVADSADDAGGDLIACQCAGAAPTPLDVDRAVGEVVVDVVHRFPPITVIVSTVKTTGRAWSAASVVFIGSLPLNTQDCTVSDCITQGEEASRKPYPMTGLR